MARSRSSPGTVVAVAAAVILRSPSSVGRSRQGGGELRDTPLDSPAAIGRGRGGGLSEQRSGAAHVRSVAALHEHASPLDPVAGLPEGRAEVTQLAIGSLEQVVGFFPLTEYRGKTGEEGTDGPIAAGADADSL